MAADNFFRTLNPLKIRFVTGTLVFTTFASRVIALDRQSFWGDEGASWYSAGLPLDQMCTGAFSDHVPFYFILLKVWMYLAGDSEFAIRFLSVLFGVLDVALIYKFATRMLGKEAGLLAMALALISPLYVWYSQEARPYTLLVFLALVMLIALQRAATRPKAIAAWSTFVVSAIVAIYTHFSIFPVVATWPLFMVLLAEQSSYTLSSIRERLGKAIIAVLAVGLVVLSMVPWFWRQAQQILVLADVSSGTFSLPTALASTAVVFTLGNTIARVDVDLSSPSNSADYRLALTLTMPVIAIAFCGLVNRRNYRPHSLLVGALLLVPILALYLYAIGRHDLHPRYVIATSPGWIMLIAAGLASLWRYRLSFILASAALLIASGWALFNYYTNPRFAHDDWRSALRYVLSHERSGDAIVVDSPYAQPVVAYYHKGGLADIYSLPYGRPPTPEDIRALIADVASKHKTVWLIFWQSFFYDPMDTSSKWLEDHGALMDQQGFSGVFLFRRYSTKPIVLSPEFAPSRSLDINLEDKVRLIDYDIDESEVAEHSKLHVTLYWQSISRIDVNLRVFIHLINPAYTAWGIADGEPGYYHFPTTRWEPGMIIRDEYTVPVIQGTPPGTYKLDVGMYDGSSGKRLNILGTKVNHIVLEPVTIVKQKAQPSISGDAKARLGSQIDLLGSEAPSTAAPGSSLPVTLFWRARQPVANDYKVFVHLTDSSGRPLAQQDSVPADSTYPTNRWEEGYIVRDQYRLSLPADLPTGEYRLRVGMYDPRTGERLPVTSAQPGTDYVDLGLVQVKQ